MKLYESGEDYLEAILMLQKRMGESAVRSVDLARHMGFSKPSISHAVFTVTVGRSTSPQRSMTFCACLRQTGGKCLHTTRYTGRSCIAPRSVPNKDYRAVWFSKPSYYRL